MWTSFSCTRSDGRNLQLLALEVLCMRNHGFPLVSVRKTLIEKEDGVDTRHAILLVVLSINKCPPSGPHVSSCGLDTFVTLCFFLPFCMFRLSILTNRLGKDNSGRTTIVEHLHSSTCQRSLAIRAHDVPPLLIQVLATSSLWYIAK